MILKLAHPTDPRWLVARGNTPPETITSEEVFEKLRYGRPLIVEPGEPDAVYFVDLEGTWRRSDELKGKVAPRWVLGQWKVDELDRRVVVESGNGLAVADIRDWRDPDIAHLIAAAPDLYVTLEKLIAKFALCEEVLSSLHILEEVHGTGYSGPNYAQEREEAMIVLAKARGEGADRG